MSHELFSTLNKAQHDAVVTTDGPVLILAGAGTGKTRAITAKILYLLLEKKVPASQILALTFTEKATEEMIARVDEAMPLSYEEVAIHTFHGFCDRLLREKGVELGIDPGYRLLSQADQWLLLKQNLFSFELDYYRPLGNPHKFLHVLLNHFSRLKDEDISPKNYLAYAEDLEKKLCANKNLSAEEQATEEERHLKTAEIARAYETYQNLLLQRNCLDFGDLQFYALRLLEDKPSVLAALQDQYRYILVDEFQDTNYAQTKLVFHLAKKHKNLSVVGDDDQSIYKWRGASLSNIQAFKERFPGAKTIVLHENYRSKQTILDASYHVIQNNNPDRLEFQEGVDKKLHSQLPPEGESPVAVTHFATVEDEARATAEKIMALSRDGVPFKDMAVLVRANHHAEPFVQILKDAEIPFSVRDTRGLLHFEEIKDIVAFLRFMVKPHDSIAFFRLLSLPLFELGMSDILNLVHEAKKAGHRPLFYYLRDQLEGEKQSLPGFGNFEDFARVHEMFQDLLNVRRRSSVYHLIGKFLDVTGYVRALSAQLDTQNSSPIETLACEEKIEHIASFLDIAKGFETGDGGDFGGQKSEQKNGVVFDAVASFLDYLGSLEEAKGALPMTKNIESDAVSVLTVHSSKGLEFAHVFLPGLVQHRFPSMRRRDPIEVPQTLLNDSPPAEETHVQEERRLFYVACTRAKSGLYVSYSDRYGGKKQWKPSLFVQELLTSGKAVEKDQTEISTSSIKDIQPQSSPKKQDHTLMEERMLIVPDRSLKQLSYSKLDTFKTCPLKYKFRYNFQIPEPPAHAANFGSSVHNTVNAFYQEVKDGANPSFERLCDLYEQHWIESGYESKGHEQARKKKGLEMMERFYATEEASGFRVPAFLERSFRLKLGDKLFSGRIDRIDQLEDGTYEVIDYKTGTSRRDKNLAKDLQLSLYALVAQELFHLKVSALSLYFLEDSVKKSTSRSREDLEAVKEELLALAGDMSSSDFKPTPGFQCGFCEYRVLCHAAE